MGNDMNKEISIEGTKATCVLSGKLTAQTSPELEAAIDGLAPSICDFDIDMSQVSYISSAGLRVLVGLEKLARHRDGLMRVLDPSEAISEVLEVTGLANVFVIEYPVKCAENS